MYVRYTINDIRQYKFFTVPFVDGEWHSFLLHFTGLRKKNTVATLYIDCEEIDEVDLNEKFSRIFTKKNIPQAELRFGVSGELGAEQLHLKVQYYYCSIYCKLPVLVWSLVTRQPVKGQLM